MNAHTELCNNLLIALGSRPDLGKWWKNNTGVLQTDSGAYVAYGLPGSPDIVGLTARGTWCGLEVKTGNGILSKKQKNFKAMIESYGGIYIECRSIPDTISRLEALCKES